LRHFFVAEADNGIGKPFPQYLRKYMSYVLPLIIVVIYFKGYYDTFAPKGPKLLCIWMGVAVIVCSFHRLSGVWTWTEQKRADKRVIVDLEIVL